MVTVLLLIFSVLCFAFVGYCIFYAITHREEAAPQPEPVATEAPAASETPVTADAPVTPVPQQAQPITPVPQQAQPQPQIFKGRVWGTLGMLYSAGYAFYTYCVLYGAETENLAEVIGKAAAINSFTPFFYCLVGATLLSFVSVVGKNKICMLLALAAIIGAFFVLPGAVEMLLLPAALFLISYIRMAK